MIVMTVSFVYDSLPVNHEIFLQLCSGKSGRNVFTVLYEWDILDSLKSSTTLYSVSRRE